MKTCPWCLKQKQLDLFNKNRTKKDGHQDRCRECDSIRAKKIYRADPNGKQKAMERTKKRRQLAREYIVKYLETHPCVDCKESDIVVLQFDHIDRREKLSPVGELVNDGVSLKRVIDEINKCEVRCANCHTRRTSKQFNWYRCGLVAQKVERSAEDR